MTVISAAGNPACNCSSQAAKRHARGGSARSPFNSRRIQGQPTDLDAAADLALPLVNRLPRRDITRARSVISPGGKVII